AIAVMRIEKRLLLVGLETPVNHLGGAGTHGVLLDLLRAPAAAFAGNSFLQRLVAGPRVVVFQRRCLVEHIVGAGLGINIKLLGKLVHDGLPAPMARRQKVCRCWITCCSSASAASGPSRASASAPTNAAALSAQSCSGSSPLATPSAKTASKTAA